MGGEQGQGGRDMVAVWRVCRSSGFVCVMRRLMCGLRVRVRELRSDVRTIVDERERCKEWAGGASGSTESRPVWGMRRERNEPIMGEVV